MGKPLRVLILEDSEDDSLLILRELEQGGFEPDHLRVETRQGLQDALAAGGWDIIIADYTIPGFNALEALRLVQEEGIDLPFIIVSGSIGEETAVEAMQAGARDYLMKGNLTRLTSAVTREPTKTERTSKSRCAGNAAGSSFSAVHHAAASGSAALITDSSHPSQSKKAIFIVLILTQKTKRRVCRNYILTPTIRSETFDPVSPVSR